MVVLDQVEKCKYECGMTIELKEMFYKTTVKLVILYDNECWSIKKQYFHQISVVIQIDNRKKKKVKYKVKKLIIQR